MSGLRALGDRHRQQKLCLGDVLPFLDVNRSDRAHPRGADDIEHLHRFDGEELVAPLNRLAGADADFGNRARNRGGQQLLPRACCGRRGDWCRLSRRRGPGRRRDRFVRRGGRTPSLRLDVHAKDFPQHAGGHRPSARVVDLDLIGPTVDSNAIPLHSLALCLLDDLANRRARWSWRQPPPESIGSASIWLSSAHAVATASAAARRRRSCSASLSASALAAAGLAAAGAS